MLQFGHSDCAVKKITIGFAWQAARQAARPDSNCAQFFGVHLKSGDRHGQQLLHRMAGERSSIVIIHFVHDLLRLAGKIDAGTIEIRSQKFERDDICSALI